MMALISSSSSSICEVFLDLRRRGVPGSRQMRGLKIEDEDENENEDEDDSGRTP